MPLMMKLLLVSESVRMLLPDPLVFVKTSESPLATGPLPEEYSQSSAVFQSVLGPESAPVHVSVAAKPCGLRLKRAKTASAAAEVRKTVGTAMRAARAENPFITWNALTGWGRKGGCFEGGV